MGVEKSWAIYGIPSGKRLHEYGKSVSLIIHNPKTHYFDWAIFNSYVRNYWKGNIWITMEENMWKKKCGKNTESMLKTIENYGQKKIWNNMENYESNHGIMTS